MTVGELTQKYRELYGEPTHSRNKDYLRKRLGWRIQELAEGGLSERTVSKLIALGDQVPERWRMRQAARPPAAQSTGQEATGTRDARLPAPGTVVSRIHGGVAHHVTVLEGGFEYAGQSFKTRNRSGDFYGLQYG
jgi:hypothetical protein